MKKRKTTQLLLKRLQRLLLASGLLNICLVTLLLSMWLKAPSFDLPVSRKSDPPLARHTSSGQLMISFLEMPFEQLSCKLEEKEPVECGYLQRDFALSSLCSKFYFDIERALFGKNLEVRHVRIEGCEQLGTFSLYPGLSNKDFEALAHFAKTERWPFTPEGLFLKLRQSQSNLPKSLINAFVMTDFFKEIHKKFPHLKSLEVLGMMLEAGWETAVEARHSLHSTDALTALIAGGSQTAAKLILETESEYALRRLSDTTIFQIFDLLGKDHPLSVSFAQKILKTPRGDDVWQLAKEQTVEPESFPEDYLYMVQEGDSLWKIARKHKTNVQEIKSCNNLESDILHPGKILKIPVQFAHSEI